MNVKLVLDTTEFDKAVSLSIASIQSLNTAIRSLSASGNVVIEDQEDKWNESADGEPDGSPFYLCKIVGGTEMICNRIMSPTDGPQWAHGGLYVHGITHWRLLGNDK